MNSLTTLDYYNQNAQSFALVTVSIHENKQKFCPKLSRKYEIRLVKRD